VTTAVPVNKKFWVEAIPEMAPIIRSLGTQGRFNPYEMTRARDWSVGRVALIGDCVNAMPPTLGQGVGCAMMNALSLAAILEGTGTIEDGLTAWEQRERPLTDRTQREACEIAKNRTLRGGNVINPQADTLHTAKHAPTGTERHAL
jgi:2-methyl-3-hydroxypyridine 5-carboxylic acid dioxygenase